MTETTYLSQLWMNQALRDRKAGNARAATRAEEAAWAAAAGAAGIRREAAGDASRAAGRGRDGPPALVEATMR